MSDESCDHGIEGGCDICCEECGHTCRKHDGVNCHGRGPDDEPCTCEGFEEPPA